MAVKVGGIQVCSLSTRTADEILGELRTLAGAVDHEDFVADLCFMTYVVGGLGSDYAAGTGIRLGMVGRKQRRAIVDIEVPPGLADGQAYRTWITGALGDAATVIRDDLPRRSRAYPAPRLAEEIETLRDRGRGSTGPE